ncbi:MAG: endolytic transglycosylase MltG [Gemmatimonadota bacterium]
MSRQRRSSILLLLALLAAATWFLVISITTVRTGETERVIIAPGTTFGTVTDTLVARGVVTNRTWFTLLARLRGLDRSVQAGSYDFPPGESAWRVLNTLRSGRTAAVRFTVPEGLSLFELAALARERLKIPAESVLVAARDSLSARENIGEPAAEGFLFPETYQVPVNSSARDLVRIMTREFAAAWQPEWDYRAQARGMTRRDVVTLASIVEGEARVDSERPVIAGVYLNRLRIGMPLQADPSVQYAIEMKTGRPKTRLFEKDYEIQSPYNTYLHSGLPPGPINSPGLRSIEAALNPAQVPYLYFVAGPDGHHVFSRTYQEHLQAVAQARRARSARPGH